MVGSFALDNHENVDENAGKVDRYRQLAIKTDTICEKNRVAELANEYIKKMVHSNKRTFQHDK